MPLSLSLTHKHIYVFMHVFVSRVFAHVSSFMSLVPEAVAAASATASASAAAAVVLVVSFMTLFHILN